jgi:hypothetical protein
VASRLQSNVTNRRLGVDPRKTRYFRINFVGMGHAVRKNSDLPSLMADNISMSQSVV